MSNLDLVTGGCGFIGRHLVENLRARGRDVRVLDLDAPHEVQPGVEYLAGSVTDVEAVRQAVRGAARVFHVAGNPELWARGADDFERANHGGAETVMRAAAEAGAGRIVLTSTHAIRVRSRGEPSEADMLGPYTRAKFRAELAARRLAAEGAPVVSVAPTMPIGPCDDNLTPPMKMIADFLNRRNPAYLDFETNLIDVREVAEGHVRAAEAGEAGWTYVLGRHNLMLSEMLKRLGAISGVPMPGRRIPYWLAWTAAAVSEASSRFTGRAPRASLEGVRLARALAPVPDDPSPELGLSEWPLDRALGDAVHWLAEAGHWPEGADRAP